MIETSKNLKISVHVNFSDTENEVIEEAAILLMQGKNVIRARIIGCNIDESDNDLMRKILEEETDVDMFDPDKITIGLRNVDTSFDDVAIEEIFAAMQSFKAVIKRTDGSMDGDDQYVIYNDNKDSMNNSEFFGKLVDYVEENDSDIFPTSLKDIYTSNNDVKSIFKNYGYDDIMYIKESCISNAAFNGIILDFSLGHK